jgi:hypothetical protein
VQETLKVSTPTRIGHRSWICYPTENAKEALRWLEGFKLWEFTEGRELGVPRVGGCTLRTQLEPDGRRLRLEVNAGTITLADKQHHGVIVDVDVVAEPPAEIPRDVKEFVDWNVRFLREAVDPVFRGQ